MLTATEGLSQEELRRHILALGPVASFSWHSQQLIALRAATDVIVIIGGNRSGKSKSAEGIISRVVRREGPIYARLRNPERPLRIWCAPQTDEKAKSLWEPRLLKMFEGMQVKYIEAPHRYFKWEDQYGGGEVWLKSQEQGFMRFESDDVDLVIFDEEPEDRRVVSSSQTRLATTNGVLVLAFTPLNGMTWTHDEYYWPTANRPEYQIADRAWRRGNWITIVQQGMADNPEAVAGGGVHRILTDPGMSQAEKDARLYGRYGYSEGLLFPMWASLKTEQDSPYIIDRLPRNRAYRWFLTCDPNKRHGALLSALDHEENRYYCAEHYAEGLPDTAHAEGYRAMLKEWNLHENDVEIFADPGGAGGQAMLNLQETGFYAAPIEKGPGSVAATIKRLRRAASMDRTHRHPVTGASPAPHAYFLRSLRSTWRTGGSRFDESRLLWELRQYRQKVGSMPDTPVKTNDDLVDCARYLEAAHAEVPIWVDIDTRLEDKLKADPLSLREHRDWEKTLKKLDRWGRMEGIREIA